MPRTGDGKDLVGKYHEANEPVAKYHAEPPSWLMTSHSAADLGYHGFHPPIPDQPEDALTDANVKRGYSAAQTISAECYSSQNIIKESIINQNALAELEELMNQVLARRAESNATLPEHAFKLPQRITFSEARRQAWQTDFFNPDVPLSTIGEKIPHAKGHDLLTLLQDNKVPIPRAVWYVRGIGGNETQGMRNRHNYNPTQYSVEWANVVTGYLRKILAEIALPPAARVGLNIRQTFKGILNDPEARDKWVAKFSYCLDLVREFYAEGLVDHGVFLSWSAQQMGISNIAQANFVARIVDEYLEGMLPYRALVRVLIDGCLTKLAEAGIFYRFESDGMINLLYQIQSTAGRQHLTSLVTTLHSFMQRIFIYSPDSFVNPKNWLSSSSTIVQIMRDSPTAAAPDRTEWDSAIENDLDDISRRNDALLFRIIPERATATAKFTMGEVKLLNSINETTNLSSITILDMSLEETDRFASKLDMLLTWSITHHQYGDHRPYAVATLLSRWMDRSEGRALRRGFPPPDEMLQDGLFDWLDTSAVVTNASNAYAMSVVFGELVGRGIFSYSKYMHRLIARGEAGLLQDPPSRHRALLRSLPLIEPSAPLTNQRKVVLYGISSRTTPEEAKERELRRMLRACIPELFSGSPLNMDVPLPLDPDVLTSFSRYEQVRVLRHWFYPIFEKHIQQPVKNEDAISLQAYVALMHITALAKTYRTMLDINLKLLSCVTSPELFGAIIDTIRRHADIWACMDEHKRLLDALCAAHTIWNWETRRAQSRPLLCLLIEFLDNRHMSPVAKDHINEDATALMLGLRPPNSPTQREPSMFPRIAMLVQQDDTSLATNIWMCHGFAGNWVQEVWQHTLEALRGLQASELNTEARVVRILRYAQFLWDINQHMLPGAFDQLIFQWATGPGKMEMRHFNENMWAAMSTIILHLVARDALTAPNIMKGVVYPVWDACTTVAGSFGAVMLRTVNYLASQLLVQGRGLEDHTRLPSDRLEEIQKLKTRGRAIYTEENFCQLVAALPNLVTLEHKNDIDESLRISTAQLRTAISKHCKFRMVAYRNLELMSRAFWNVDSQTLPQDFERHLGGALQQILSDSKPWVLQINAFDWRTLSSFLSPWRYARTAIELQLALRTLGAGLRDEELKDKARNDLCAFGSSFFGQPLTSEETDLIADMLRGISGVVACNLINSGMQRMTELFRDLSDLTEKALQILLHNAGEALHLMSSILQPLRVDAAGLPTLEPDVQDAFIGSIHAATKRLDEVTSEEEETADDMTNLVVIVARLWQFDLCLPGAWTGRLREVVGDVLTRVVKLAIKYSTGVRANSIVFDVLLDTAFVLFDEIPRDTKAPTTDLFQYVANISPASLPFELPNIQRRRLASLLSFVPDDAYIKNLHQGWQSPTSNTFHFGPEVQNNPWEWAESIEPAVDTSVFTREKPELKNSSSIPLEVFGTQATGERVFGEMTSDRDAAAARQLEDGLAADNVFERDWRETRVDWKTDWRADLSNPGEFATAGGNTRDVPIDSEREHIKQEPGSASLSPAHTARSSAASSRVARASSVLSTSSGTGRGAGKRKAESPVSADMEPAARGGARSRGRPRGSITGRGKSKKK
ncbi:hypothetical protein BU17DRAFT_35400 [Hysterangium stoloniferum]|nr:hypothetical protein BU17DRAFT_35400 [Hysterangium stoloniferum]